MSSDILNFNKPCSACRRRKVRCDKAQPCNNCLRHGVACLYESPKESVANQQMLQERVERLERIVEDMAAFTLAGAGAKDYHKSSTMVTSPLSNDDDSLDAPLESGSQVLESGGMYPLSPDYLMNLAHLVQEPRYVNIDTDNICEESLSWAMSPGPSMQKDIAHLHLATGKEDCLLGLFFQHVDPFIRTVNQGYIRQVVSEFREGTSLSAREAEALLLAAQHLAASVLPGSLIAEKLVLPKADLVMHLQRAAEIAFERANVMRTRNVALFNALLYYSTCKFHTGDFKAGAALLGLASKIACRIGMHRDPAHYGYAAWIAEARRRMWGHLVALDAAACCLEGPETVLMGLGDVRRATNVDDVEWASARDVRRDPGPRDREGFTDSTCALIRREVGRAYHGLAERQRAAASCEELMAVVEESEKYVRLKFIRHFDGSDPVQHVITYWYKAMVRAMRITVIYSHASRSRSKLRCHSFDELQDRLFHECVDCLERFEQGEIAATPHQWQWAFRWPMLLQAIAGLLSGLARRPDHPDKERAWTQVEAAFRRCHNEDVNVAKVPLWHAVEMLCDQAMAHSPDRQHEGRHYARRIHEKDLVNITAASSTSNTTATSTPPSDSIDQYIDMSAIEPALLGDSGLFGADMSDATLSQMLATAGSGVLSSAVAESCSMDFCDGIDDGGFSSLDL